MTTVVAEVVAPQRLPCSRCSADTIRHRYNGEFVIRSVNNLKTAKHKIVNQSENGYGRDNYTDC